MTNNTMRRQTARYDNGALHVQDHMIDSGTPGIRLLVRNKRLQGKTAITGEKTVLFVHGSTLPSESSFDLQLGGKSWMDVLARDGYDAFFVDIRGYGGSDRPPEMDLAAMDNPPVVRTETAVADLAKAVEFICRHKNIERLNLIGWSWGTTIAGAYTADNNSTVAKLVLIAPQWLRTDSSTSDPGGDLGAYRTITPDMALQRWQHGVPEGAWEALVPEAWQQAWVAGVFSSDPWGREQQPKKLRAPNGTVLDSREFWASGKPFYDPGQITRPVLLLHAEWDSDLPIEMAKAYFGKLTGTPYKQWLEIGEGTHSVILEKNRELVFAAVRQFFSCNFKPQTCLEKEC